MDLTFDGLRYAGVDGKGLPFRSAMPSLIRKQVEDRPEGVVEFFANKIILDRKQKTFVYIHGWKDNGRVDADGAATTQLVFNRLQEAYGNSVNIVSVNWQTLALIDPSPLSFDPGYEASVTKQVGEVVADALIRAGVDINRVILSGHSLGSFVAAAAANELKLRTGLKVRKLIALDTAATNPLWPEYDIDARNGFERSFFTEADRPYDFTTDLAQATLSYTVVDDIDLGSLASNIKRAATAQKAYLVAYVPSDYSLLNTADSAALYHSGVVAAFTDLVVKRNLAPMGRAARRFNEDGIPTDNGSFSGLVLAPQPWITSPTEPFRGVRSIGWADEITNPIINGSDSNDVLFFDRIYTSQRQGAQFFGRGGGDLVGGNASGGRDQLTGGPDRDTFFFGYTKNGTTVLPYVGTGKVAYATVKDFNPSEDRLTFGWSKNELAITNGGAELENRWGSGLAVRFQGDLIAYIPGLNEQAVPELFARGAIQTGIAQNLDQLMFV
jgi:pimeloyl-ACP methyl ester carboxylesterase